MTTIKVKGGINSVDPYIVRAKGNDGTEYHYGVFISRLDAIDYGMKELSGFPHEVLRISLLERE